MAPPKKMFMLNPTLSDLYMNIPGIDSNNYKDMADVINNICVCQCLIPY